MKFFAVLAVCLAVATARPDVSGYAYPKPPVGYSNENYIAQPPLTTYTGDASNTQFQAVPGQTFTTVTRGGGFDNSFDAGLSGGNTFSSGIIGGAPAVQTVKTVTTTRTDGGNFGQIGGLDSGVNRITTVQGGNGFSTGGGNSFTSGSLGGGSGFSTGSLGTSSLGGGVTEYTTVTGGSPGFAVGGSIGSGLVGGGGVKTTEYTTVTGGGQGGTGLRGSFGTGSLGGGLVSTNEYTTLNAGNSGFGTQLNSGSLDGRFGQQTITNLGGNYHQEKTRYVNVQTEYVTRPPIITKNFYVHGAPEDDEDIVARQRIHVPAPQKHYKIIFIKAPQPVGFSAGAIPPPVQNEEKTIVYVLVKKPEDTNQEIEIPAPPPTPPTKPEVYFIKYKGKDATQTIQTIQNQYADQGVIAGQGGYTAGGITSGFVPGGSSTSFTKTVGRFGGDDGATVTGTSGTGSTTITKTVTTGGNDGGVQFVASAPTGGSSFTTKTVTTGGNDGGVQFLGSAPTPGSAFVTKTITSGGGGDFIASAPGGITSYTTKTVSGGSDGGAQFVASAPTGGSTFTTKTITTGGGNAGFGTGLRFDGEASGDSGSTYTLNSAPVSGVTYTTKTINSEQVGGGDSGFNVLRFGGTDGIENTGHSSQTFIASAPTTTFTTKTVQVPSSTYEYISGGSSGTLPQSDDCCGGKK